MELRLARRMERLGTETAFEVLAEVTRLKQQGRSVVSFAIGEPDFDTPGNIREAAKRAIDEGFTHYGPSAGMPEALEAVAGYVSRTRGFDVKPSEVVITPGAKPIIAFSVLALVDEGDEVIYPNPGFPIYESMIQYVGGVPVPLPLVEERGFSFDPDVLAERITDRTKMLILNSPQNPTGGVIPSEDLDAVARMAVERGLWVLSDEIYSRIYFEGGHDSIATRPGMRERTVILDGHSKTYAMTGWRLGYGVMPERLATGVARLMTNTNSCTASMIQKAGIEALTGPQDEAEGFVATFKKRRDLIVAGLNDLPGVRCLNPRGAFYVFPNVTEACRQLGFEDSRGLQSYLLHDAGVAVLARTCFGRKNDGESEEYVRLSYATSTDNIREGLKRMAAALSDPARAAAFRASRS